MTHDATSLLTALRQQGRRVVMIAAGGGSAAIPALVAIPGASAVVDEALVPSARAAVDGLLGGPQETYCSSRTARRMAMAAWERCCGYGAGKRAAVGVGCTASLVTTVPKRGEHRVVVAVQTSEETSVATLVLAKGRRSRAEEEALAAALLLERMASVVEASTAPVGRLDRHLRPEERIVVDRHVAATAWTDLLRGVPGAVRLGHDAGPPTDRGPGAEAIFAGSFDPLHDGHRAMARIGARVTGLPVAYELSIRNVDKPPLDYLETSARVNQFSDARVWLTSAPTFVEKLSLFPGAPFLVGADTYVRLGNPRYYGDSAERAAAAVERISRESGGLVVFGRVCDGQFTEPSRLEAPPTLRSIARFVTEREFRDDISSTMLRRARGEPAD
jgi:nicotinamide mononucleotide (NMN) deamidase PncC